MIRFRRLPLALLDDWLVDQRLLTHLPNYRLRIWRENRASLEEIKCELVAYINEAHDDARMRLRQGFEDDLSPFSNPSNDPAANYPCLLHKVTLQGYFGETLAGMAVEHWGAHGHADWAVPAFLFRLHNQEFQHLDIINERLATGELYDPDVDVELRPGRTGDDCLAFRMNDENVITDILTLEAKCITKSNNATIKAAHEKLSAGTMRPSGILELINLLDDYETPEAQAWQQALLNLWKGGYQAIVRHDAVAYACGQIPRKPAGRVAWMPTDAPHPSYTGERRLEGLEFQFQDLDTIMDLVYRGL
jgi:hypothetical protein